MSGRFSDILFWLLMILIIVVAIWFAQLPPRPVPIAKLETLENLRPLENDNSSNSRDGFLEIISAPKADTLYVDSLKFSQGTPHAGSFPAGEHRIKCIYVARNRTWESTVTLLPDERKTIHIVLE
ncbi:MAG: hypothetical protein ACOY90_01210 [Candidatus Zhuqueibacterota bacterium]